MNKLITKIVLFLFSLLIPALVLSEAIPQKEAKVLVVYYSRTGHTRLVAEKLAKKFGADLEQLIDQHKRTGLFSVFFAGKDAVSSKVTVINPLKHNPRDYDTILIGGPSWVGNVTPAIRAFITQNDLSGKKIALFGLCHFTGVENAMQETADLVSKGKKEKLITMLLRESELTEETLIKKIDAFYQAI